MRLALGLLALLAISAPAADLCTCAGWNVRMEVTAEGHPAATWWYVTPPGLKGATPPPVPVEPVAQGDALTLTLTQPGEWRVQAVVQYDHFVAHGATYHIPLDRTIQALGPGCVFADGFESGTTDQWEAP